MRLTILTENCAGGKFQAEHGLSYLVEMGDSKILFDTGHSDLFLKNANKLGIDIQSEVSKIVLSHGHWDHGDGLRFLQNKTLITHPNSFIKRFHKGEQENIGLELTKDEIETKFDLITSASAITVEENIIFLGEVPRKNNFEAQTTAFVDENGNKDFVTDDSVLAVVSGTELIVISGCAHAGICNTISHAKEVTGLDKVKAVIGGFHLKFDNRQTEETIQFLKNENIETIIPSHCTALPALAAFYREFQIKHLQTGMVLNF